MFDGFLEDPQLTPMTPDRCGNSTREMADILLGLLLIGFGYFLFTASTCESSILIFIRNLKNKIVKRMMKVQNKVDLVLNVHNLLKNLDQANGEI